MAYEISSGARTALRTLAGGPGGARRASARAAHRDGRRARRAARARGRSRRRGDRRRPEPRRLRRPAPRLRNAADLASGRGGRGARARLRAAVEQSGRLRPPGFPSGRRGQERGRFRRRPPRLAGDGRFRSARPDRPPRAGPCHPPPARGSPGGGPRQPGPRAGGEDRPAHGLQRRLRRAPTATRPSTRDSASEPARSDRSRTST